MSEDYYQILEISKNATEQDIKKAFRRLAVKYHPDKNPNSDGEMFKKITEAHEILSDPNKRKIYDTHGKKGLEAMNGMNGMNMNEFFMGHPFAQAKKSKVTIYKTTLEELFVGNNNATSDVELDDDCLQCNGTGNEDKIDLKCKTCKGNCYITQVINMGIFIQQQRMPCPDCGGKGKRTKNNIKQCKLCQGKGKKIIQLNFVILPRTSARSNLLTDVEYNGSSIPVRVCMDVAPHPYYEILEDGNIKLNMTIQLGDAICGFKKSIPFLDGSKLYIVQHFGEVIQPGQIKTYTLNKSHGELQLFIEFKINFPKNIKSFERENPGLNTNIFKKILGGIQDQPMENNSHIINLNSLTEINNENQSGESGCNQQ
jgi:DnaJ-class molecular chaperone